MDDGWLRHALEAKRDGDELDDATWHRIIGSYGEGTIDDAALAALAMACAIRGMSDAEIASLTDAMVASGDRLTFHHLGHHLGTVVDKHSSGGVGDTVSLIVVPLVAACGVPVAKLSGRSLGHTGGTLDKLEAIPGVRTDLSPAEITAQVERLGCAIAAQSDRLAPADKKLYALRDRTGSVRSVGLIASSIVSKKIAAGADAIVFDVKAGRGAFMRTHGEARLLAQTLVRLSTRFGRRVSALVTDMEQPLGAAIGTGIEAIEARDFLRGDARDARLADAVHAVAHEMLRVGGVAEAQIEPHALDALESGAAYERFVQMIEAQGGSGIVLEGIAPHPHRATATAPRDGFVTAIDAFAIGKFARRLVATDGPLAGIRIVARTGTPVRRGDVLAEIAGRGVAPHAVARSFAIAPSPVPERPLIHGILRDAETTPAAGAVRA